MKGRLVDRWWTGEREQNVMIVRKRHEKHQRFQGQTVAPHVRDEGVGGSNPLTPTKSSRKSLRLPTSFTRGVIDEQESLIDATLAMVKRGGAEVGPTKRGKGLKLNGNRGSARFATLGQHARGKPFHPMGVLPPEFPRRLPHHPVQAILNLALLMLINGFNAITADKLYLHPWVVLDHTF